MLPDWIKIFTLQKKHDSGWFFSWIFLDTGSTFFQSMIKKTANEVYKQKSAKHYNLHFADFFYMPIPVRTRKIGQIKINFLTFTAVVTNRYLHRWKKGLTTILQILVGTLLLSADSGKVLFINSILVEFFRHRRRQRCATFRVIRFEQRTTRYHVFCCVGTLIQSGYM